MNVVITTGVKDDILEWMRNNTERVQKWLDSQLPEWIEMQIEKEGNKKADERRAMRAEYMTEMYSIIWVLNIHGYPFQVTHYESAIRCDICLCQRDRINGARELQDLLALDEFDNEGYANAFTTSDGHAYLYRGW